MLRQISEKPNQAFALIRGGEWWLIKGAPVMGTAYATAFILNSSLIKIWYWLLFLLFSLSFIAIFAHLLNDFSDQEQDVLSGKSNQMAGRSPSVQIFILISCTIPIGLCVILLLQYPWLLIVYLSMVAIFMAYSLRPLRLKERSFRGTIADALGAHVLPQVFAVLLVSQVLAQPVPIVWLGAITLWSLATGLRGIFWHQLIDLENDRAAGVNTFAIIVSPKYIIKVAKLALLPIEILMLALIFFITKMNLVWFFFVLYLSTEWLRHHFWNATPVAVDPLPNHRFIFQEYYELFYPFTFLLLAVNKDISNLIVLAVHLLIYPQRIWWWFRDVWFLLRWEIVNKTIFL